MVTTVLSLTRGKERAAWTSHVFCLAPHQHEQWGNQFDEYEEYSRQGFVYITSTIVVRATRRIIVPIGCRISRMDPKTSLNRRPVSDPPMRMQCDTRHTRTRWARSWPLPRESGTPGLLFPSRWVSTSDIPHTKPRGWVSRRGMPNCA